MNGAYLIVANGPFVAKSILQELIQKTSCIVALDGAAVKLVRLGIRPHFILGDFDSIDKEMDILYLEQCGVIIMPDYNQDFTDLQKAIRFIKTDASTYGFSLPQTIDIICGMGGGRIDHEFANYLTLKNEYDPGCIITSHNDHNSIYYATNQTTMLRGQPGDYCGFFGLPEGEMRILNQGLQYGDDDKLLLHSGFYSSSNRMTKAYAEVEISGDVLVIHPPMLEAQRAFLKHSDHVRYSILAKESEVTTSHIHT